VEMIARFCIVRLVRPCIDASRNYQMHATFLSQLSWLKCFRVCRLGPYLVTARV
jgi:hypothetical protein